MTVNKDLEDKINEISSSIKFSEISLNSNTDSNTNFCLNDISQINNIISAPEFGQLKTGEWDISNNRKIVQYGHVPYINYKSSSPTINFLYYDYKTEDNSSFLLSDLNDTNPDKDLNKGCNILSGIFNLISVWPPSSKSSLFDECTDVPEYFKELWTTFYVSEAVSFFMSELLLGSMGWVMGWGNFLISQLGAFLGFGLIQGVMAQIFYGLIRKANLNTQNDLINIKNVLTNPSQSSHEDVFETYCVDKFPLIWNNKFFSNEQTQFPCYGFFTKDAILSYKGGKDNNSISTLTKFNEDNNCSSVLTPNTELYDIVVLSNGNESFLHELYCNDVEKDKLIFTTVPILCSLIDSSSVSTSEKDNLKLKLLSNSFMELGWLFLYEDNDVYQDFYFNEVSRLALSDSIDKKLLSNFNDYFWEDYQDYLNKYKDFVLSEKTCLSNTNPYYIEFVFSLYKSYDIVPECFRLDDSMQQLHSIYDSCVEEHKNLVLNQYKIQSLIKLAQDNYCIDDYMARQLWDNYCDNMLSYKYLILKKSCLIMVMWLIIILL